MEVAKRRGVTLHGVIGGDGHANPEASHDLDECFDVPDSRDVLDANGRGHEERGGEEGKRLVLVPARRHGPADGMPALDDEPVVAAATTHRRQATRWRRTVAASSSSPRPGAEGATN
jgi:hypothetical protein